MLIITLLIRIRTALSYAWFFRPGTDKYHMWVWNGKGQEIPPCSPEYPELVQNSIYYGLYGLYEKKIMSWRIWKVLHLVPEVEENKQLEFDF